MPILGMMLRIGIDHYVDIFLSVVGHHGGWKERAHHAFERAWNTIENGHEENVKTGVRFLRAFSCLGTSKERT